MTQGPPPNQNRKSTYISPLRARLQLLSNTAGHIRPSIEINNLQVPKGCQVRGHTTSLHRRHMPLVMTKKAPNVPVKVHTRVVLRASSFLWPQAIYPAIQEKRTEVKPGGKGLSQLLRNWSGRSLRQVQGLRPGLSECQASQDNLVTRQSWTKGPGGSSIPD